MLQAIRETLNRSRLEQGGSDDHVESRPGFMAMLKRIEGNGVRTIIVETASRFARDLMAVGVDKDSERRQREAISGFAKGADTTSRRFGRSSAPFPSSTKP